MSNNLIEPILNVAACEKILENTHEGTLGMCHENIPYAVPMNHAFVDGKFFFHGALRGRKIDMMKKNPNIVYVISKYHGKRGTAQTKKSCHGPWESIVAYGTARIVQDLDGKTRAFKIFMKYYGVDDFKMTNQGRNDTGAIIMDVTSMTARCEMVRHSKEYWLWLPQEPKPESARDAIAE